MSYGIGRRINELRTEKKMSQEDVASALGISRQRLARIESGQSEASYEMIKQLADRFAVPVSSITSADEEIDLPLYFRDAHNSDHVNEAVEEIVDILKTFHAHEKLYYRMKGEDDAI